MKKCAYCGRENDDDATQCRECGTGEFLAPGPAPTQPLVEAGKDEAEAITPAEDSIPELSIPGESAVCPTCHTLNLPEVTFCRRCGAPIGFISTIGPLEAAYAEGFAYRRAVEGRPQFIIVVGIWLLFFPSLVASIGFSLSILKTGMDGIGGFVGLIRFFLFWICVGFGVISALMLYRVTRNYLIIRKRKSDATDT
jgi:ribosomal protein L40E